MLMEEIRVEIKKEIKKTQ